MNERKVQLLYGSKGFVPKEKLGVEEDTYVSLYRVLIPQPCCKCRRIIEIDETFSKHYLWEARKRSRSVLPWCKECYPFTVVHPYTDGVEYAKERDNFVPGN